MEQLKLNKLKNSTVIGGVIVIIGIACFIIWGNSNKYIYEQHLKQILGIGSVKIKNKTLNDSWAIGEWYICETYDLDQESVNLFICGSQNNSLYSADSLWFKIDWQKLPIENQYQDIKDLVLNYSANNGIDKQIDKMKTVFSANSGYYSIMSQPSFEDPQKVIFFLLDQTKNQLFIINTKL
ncbi:MAG: hypothetical protein LBU84_18945 [Prevotella sp.]|jgi:hypothetical protein|nr:hypothetical protein [Prevotella sp.]